MLLGSWVIKFTNLGDHVDHLPDGVMTSSAFYSICSIVEKNMQKIIKINK